MSDESHVTVTEGHSDREGGCNACGRHIESTGPVPHKVLEISLHRCSVRVCDACAKELLKKLAARINQVFDVNLTVVIPEHEEDGVTHPGDIEPGVYDLNEIVELMRVHKRDPKAIQFLSDMMEP